MSSFFPFPSTICHCLTHFFSFSHILTLSHTPSLSFSLLHPHIFFSLLLCNIFSVTSIHKHLTCILTYKLFYSLNSLFLSFFLITLSAFSLSLSPFFRLVSFHLSHLCARVCVWVFSIPYPFSTFSFPRVCCTNSDRFLWPEIVQTSETNSKPSCQETITQVSVQSIY